MKEALGEIHTLHKLGTVVHACYLSTLEVEAGGPGIQGHLPLQSESKTSLGYMRVCR